jgi:hypothetical protein
VRLEGLNQLKNPMASSGIETASCRIVVECLNQLHCRVPNLLNSSGSISFSCAADPTKTNNLRLLHTEQTKIQHTNKKPIT